MLVLMRRPNETIHIGDNITITILQNRPGGVRVGIEAPNDLNIYRGELSPTKEEHQTEDRGVSVEGVKHE